MTVMNSKRSGVGRSRVINKKGRLALPRLVKINLRQTVAQLSSAYNAGPRSTNLEHIVLLVPR